MLLRVVLVDQAAYGGVGGGGNGGAWGSTCGQEGSAGVWAAVVYSAVGPGALANLLQMKGQRIVPAAEAQVILLTWSSAAAIAWRSWGRLRGGTLCWGAR